MQGMQPDVALLQGLALVEQLGEEQVVVHYPARGLSKDPATRFAQLFATRPRHADHTHSQATASPQLCYMCTLPCEHVDDGDDTQDTGRSCRRALPDSCTLWIRQSEAGSCWRSSCRC